MPGGIRRRFEDVVNLGWKLDNPTETFEIVEVLDRSERGIHVGVKTESGVKQVWVPFSVAGVYQYERDGQVFREVVLPEWFTKKTGLK